MDNLYIYIHYNVGYVAMENKPLIKLMVGLSHYQTNGDEWGMVQMTLLYQHENSKYCRHESTCKCKTKTGRLANLFSEISIDFQSPL